MQRRGWGLVIGVVLAVASLTSCAGDRDAEPTVASVDFTPRLVLVVSPDGLEVEEGDRPGASLDPPSVPAGSVVEVRNDAPDERRVVSGSTIDTGVMQPGDTTTVVLAAEGDVELRDTATGATTTIAVTARAGGG